MPSWVGPRLALTVLVGFAGFAFRQGTKVKPTKNDPYNWKGDPTGGLDGGWITPRLRRPFQNTRN